MKILFVVNSAELGYWLAELPPYRHFAERGYEIDFASPNSGTLKYDATSDPYSENSWEANDLVSKGFLADKFLLERVNASAPLSEVDPALYDAVHIVGGGGAAVDLYPNARLTRILEHFWSKSKLISAICHGVNRTGE